jgi:hypothetical protein
MTATWSAVALHKTGSDARAASYWRSLASRSVVPLAAAVVLSLALRVTYLNDWASLLVVALAVALSALGVLVLYARSERPLRQYPWRSYALVSDWVDTPLEVQRDGVADPFSSRLADVPAKTVGGIAVADDGLIVAAGSARTFLHVSEISAVVENEDRRRRCIIVVRSHGTSCVLIPRRGGVVDFIRQTYTAT